HVELEDRALWIARGQCLRVAVVVGRELGQVGVNELIDVPNEVLEQAGRIPAAGEAGDFHWVAVEIEIADCGVHCLGLEAVRLDRAYDTCRHGPLKKVAKGSAVLPRLLAVLKSDYHR